MAGITIHLKSINGKVVLEDDVSNRKLNDDRIIDVALFQANKNPDAHIFVLSDDVYFSLQNIKVTNLSFLTLSDYEKQIVLDEDNFNLSKTVEFCNYVKIKNLEKVRQYDLLGVNLNYIDPTTGFTSLIQAIRNRDIKIIEFLTSLKKVDLNIRDSSKYKLSPIAHAVQINNKQIVKILINKGCDFDLGSLGVNRGNTPMIIASWSGFYEIARILFDEGACLNQQDDNGYTPLMKACIRGHPDIVKLLINHTDLTIRSREEKTAREYITKKEIYDIFDIVSKNYSEASYD